MNISNTLKVIIAIAAIAVFLVGCGATKYNAMVNQEEEVSKAWNNVETQYQRRVDLIPNLVNTVKGYAAHEKSTFEAVIAARAKATQVTVNPENMTPEKLQQYQAAQGEITSALGRLIAISENYPDLKANENFQELQAQLEGTENRINESRNKFNAAVKTYNVTVRTFPTNIFANIFGFDKKNGFEAEAGASKAPTVEF
ncbi:MAG TPA: LemA family protein [Prevotellaceae bacterium]|jgi:LemA protein|nr:LemA family protein [Prevotellaceae bacterium]